MIVISFALVKFYAFAILYVLIVMQIKLVVVVVVVVQLLSLYHFKALPLTINIECLAGSLTNQILEGLV